MEVGAVKQSFNNEVILLKKKLNQAKIQVIHKLTRKAKTLTEKKAPEQLKEKLKRKAESAVNEVLIIKKIKAKDLAKFIVTHNGELKQYLNKPQVDEDKACARLLLHKALQDKYKFIRGRFSNVSIKDLFMSRLERQKMKKEAKEKQKNKKKGQETKVVNSEGDWNVEDVEIEGKDVTNDIGSDILSGTEHDDSEIENGSDNDIAQSGDELSETDAVHNNLKIEKDEISDNEILDDDEPVKVSPKYSKPVLNIKQKAIISNSKNIENKLKDSGNLKEVKKNLDKKQLKQVTQNPDKKHKDVNKNKNFNEKILQRKFKKESDAPVVDNKIVDPFFITATGENYMSVVEPRQPDEVKEIHIQGNRKLRRATMFGYAPKIKPRYDNSRQDNFNKQNGFEQASNLRKFNGRMEPTDKRLHFNDRNKPVVEEKLHPSWEAKKKKSGILPFEGKKIVFDDS